MVMRTETSPEWPAYLEQGSTHGPQPPFTEATQGVPGQLNHRVASLAIATHEGVDHIVDCRAGGRRAVHALLHEGERKRHAPVVYGAGEAVGCGVVQAREVREVR